MEYFNSFVQYISELNSLSITIRLLMAVICGGLIGIERGRKGQAAGARTHMLVCIGSALVMMTNIFVVNEYSPNSDPTRIGAQVVSGIGFLGAGTILITSKNQVRGLTTAAGLWASACMGLAIGVGFYELAIIGNVFIFIVISALNNLDRKIYGESRRVEMYIEFEDSHVLKRLIVYTKENNLELVDIQVIKNKAIDNIRTGAIFTLRSKEKRDHAAILADLSEIKGLLFIEEI
jgi:putative Mg2+ transporter-C (MgtC) family protein